MIGGGIRAVVVPGVMALALVTGPSESHAFFDWLCPWLRSPANTGTTYVPPYPAQPVSWAPRYNLAPRVAGVPVMTAGSPTTACYVPQVSYRMVVQPVAANVLRPVVSCDPCTGCPVTTYRPVTMLTSQAVWVPVTTYRLAPASPCLPRAPTASCGSGCVGCSPGSAAPSLGPVPLPGSGSTALPGMTTTPTPPPTASPPLGTSPPSTYAPPGGFLGGLPGGSTSTGLGTSGATGSAAQPGGSPPPQTPDPAGSRYSPPGGIGTPGGVKDNKLEGTYKGSLLLPGSKPTSPPANGKTPAAPTALPKLSPADGRTALVPIRSVGTPVVPVSHQVGVQAEFRPGMDDWHPIDLAGP